MASRLLVHHSARAVKLALRSQHYHVSARREIAPIVFGLGVFVAANAAAYVLRALESKRGSANGEPGDGNEEEVDETEGKLHTHDHANPSESVVWALLSSCGLT